MAVSDSDGNSASWHIGANLRHLRAFTAVADCGSVTQAAGLCNVSQPAVTQAMNKLESIAGQALFLRSSQGIFLTDAGRALDMRVRRALGLLDAAIDDIAQRLRLTATRPQLESLVATVEAQNFSLAARRLGLSQPTVHRAVTQLEKEAGRALFQRSPYGVSATRQARALATASRLAFVELEQAAAELAEIAGREVGRVVIGAMPLARSSVLPRALTRFRRARPRIGVQILEGTYDELLGGMRRGEIDMLVGALRFPAPIDDVVQEHLFDDTLVCLCGHGHPLARTGVHAIGDLSPYPWLVTRAGTPSRGQFAAHFAAHGLPEPEALIETGSAIIMREMLTDNLHLACISRQQMQTEIERDLVHVLDWQIGTDLRPIGVTIRKDWIPTPAQAQILTDIRAVARRSDLPL